MIVYLSETLNLFQRKGIQVVIPEDAQVEDKETMSGVYYSTIKELNDKDKFTVCSTCPAPDACSNAGICDATGYNY